MHPMVLPYLEWALRGLKGSNEDSSRVTFMVLTLIEFLLLPFLVTELWELVVTGSSSSSAASS